MNIYVITVHDHVCEDSQVDSAWLDIEKAYDRLDAIPRASGGHAQITVVPEGTVSETYWAEWITIGQNRSTK